MGKDRSNRFTIGVLPGWQAYSGQLDSYLDNVLYGIQSAAHEHEVNLMLACGVGVAREIDLGRPAWPVSQPGIDFIPVGPWNMDGLIVLPPLADETGTRYFNELKATGYPLVFAGEWEASPAVIVDNEGGILQAIAHLVEHGHRQIALIAGRNHLHHGDSNSRFHGYLAGLQTYGLAYDPRLVAYGHHTFLGGKQAMQNILAAGKEFTAVLASNDESAVGAMEALQQAGLLVPQDVALIGFDDRIEARAQIPLLTTVHYPMFDLGYQSVDLLLKKIQQPDLDEILQIPTRLVVRESCGCLPGVIARSVAGDEIRSPVESQAGAGLPGAELNAQGILPAITRVTYNEVLRISLKEVEYLCKCLVEAFETSLAQADPLPFRLTVQQVAWHVAVLGDDLRTWQEAISVLRGFLPALIRQTGTSLTYPQIEDMLHQARVAISEVSRGQTAQLWVRQAIIGDGIGQMAGRFFAAQDEGAVYAALAQSLPAIGIQHAVVAFYLPEGQDPAAWSELQNPPGPPGAHWKVPTRSFPPDDLYPADRPYNLVLLPMTIPGMVSGFVAFDAGNLQSCAVVVRQLEAALKGVRLYRAAVEARQQAEEERKSAEAANRMKSRFLSVVSHELRTPLNLISSLSSALLVENGQAGARTWKAEKEDLERLQLAAQHLNSLIRDVLDLAQSDVGQLKLMRTPLDMKSELEAAAVIGQQLAASKGLAWRADIPHRLPAVWGDRTRLRQVILNLVNNAVKFTTRGEIRLSASSGNGCVTINVQDTGLGIPAEEQKAIFEEFHQSERTTARGYGGLGLGLSICKRLVELHGGEIGVSSAGIEGQGSAFYFTLPVMESQPAGLPVDIAPGKGQRVLLLVNDLANGQRLKNYLLEQAFEVSISHAAGEPDWLEKLLRQPPDVLVLDLELTSQRGWEILKLLKENPQTRHIPVLFYTLDDAQKSGSLLEIDYMTKPVGTQALAESLLTHGLLNEYGERGTMKDILIVDDDPAILELHTRIVQAESANYRVITARNGREALAAIRQQAPDLVLLDLMMPEVNGFAVLEAMREEEECHHIPVIVLTGQALTGEDMARLNRGAASVLSKGMFSVKETLQHISGALMNKRRPGSEAQRIAMKAMAFINENYTEAISLHEVARCVGVSARHLTRCFRQEMGISPTTYLNRLRIKQAKTLIDQGEKSITRIAMDVGFSTGAYFTRVFKEEVGMAPRDYLKNRKE